MGRPALHDHVTRLNLMRLRPRVEDLVVHDTSNPKIIVAEFNYRGTMVRDRPVTRRNVFVVTVRNGAIVHSRDYQSDAH